MYHKKSSLAKRLGEEERKEAYQQQRKGRGHLERKYSMLCTSHRCVQEPCEMCIRGAVISRA